MPKKQESDSGGGVPPWMVTYSDLMTLLLTFFVLLISMSYIDERRIRDFLVITRGSSFGERMFSPLSSRDSMESVQPGPMDSDDLELEFIRQMVWEDKHLDLNLETNRYVAIISIGEETLFERGSSQISEKGRLVLDTILPQLQGLGYPLLVAGHTSNLRDENLGGMYDSSLSNSPGGADVTWKLSLSRALAVYVYLKSKNLSGLKIMNEGFGEHRPKVNNETPENRAINRRVDLVLDRRNGRQIDPNLKPVDTDKNNVYELDEFRFRLDLPEQPSGNEGRQVIPSVQPERLREDPFDPARMRLEERYLNLPDTGTGGASFNNAEGGR